MKINLKQQIVNIKGEPIKTPELNTENQPIIEKGKRKMKNVCIRDSFLTILGSHFEMKDKKEPFWTTDLGMACAKQNVLEIEGEQLEFLKRIIKNNKTKQPLPMGGEQEIEVFFPFEVSQILKALMTEEEKKQL